MERRWTPPERERRIGLGGYATEAPGTGGTIKVTPEDFQVREISEYPMPVPDGPYTVLRIRARNWEQHELVRRLESRWRLPPGALGWAGTRDRRAVTDQLFSYRGPPPALDAPVPEGVEILERYAAQRGVALGHHYGNSFEIVVREADLAGPALTAALDRLRRELRGLGTIPNYFGLQRFGEVRPVTHLVGRALVQGDPRGAVEAYLTEPTPEEAAAGAEARRAYAEHHDPARALREFPASYGFERLLLDHLARGQEPSRALRALPRPLRLLFIHAYQSLLFNRYLTARLAAGLPSDRPEPGDRLLRRARDGTLPGPTAVPVAEDNLPECRELVATGRAVLAGPLVGADTPLLGGAPGEILERLLAEDGVRRPQFDLPHHPELASRGNWRPLFLPVPPLVPRPVLPAGDGAAERAYRLDFALPKGAYATVLLREFLKSGAAPGRADSNQA